ncbi:MAG TPA: signal peptidase II [Pyrinomonadaceae bacterium]|nr:signal peptidase II [Pyrinomonadaceae bacterium]
MSGERRIAWRVAYFCAAFGVYLVDQVTKAWAVRNLRSGQTVTLVSGLLDLTYAENPGIAFGQLQEGGSIGRWVLVGLAVAAGLCVLVYLFRSTRTDDRMLGACALLLAGIAGNLTDRARFGFVIDFILLHYKSYHWPVFNVADMSICAGAALLIFDVFKSRSQKSGVRSQEKIGGRVAGTQETE